MSRPDPQGRRAGPGLEPFESGSAEFVVRSGTKYLAGILGLFVPVVVFFLVAGHWIESDTRWPAIVIGGVGLLILAGHWYCRIEVRPAGLLVYRALRRTRHIPFATLDRIVVDRGRTFNGLTPLILTIHYRSPAGPDSIRTDVATLPRLDLQRLLETAARRAPRIELDHIADRLRNGESLV